MNNVSFINTNSSGLLTDLKRRLSSVSDSRFRFQSAAARSTATRKRGMFFQAQRLRDDMVCLAYRAA
jgi:hypothetical protein